MTDIVKRLRQPPFGTETSERNIMTEAADEIDRLREWLGYIADGNSSEPQESAITCVMGWHLRPKDKTSQ
jgi:hypothetical protein